MPYDEALAGRIRRILHTRPGIALSERKMFGGIAFMLRGNMCCCLTNRGLMVRVGAAAYPDALAHPHAGPMDLTGRPMRGWVLVAPAGLTTAADLSDWVNRGAAFAAALPPK